MTVPQIREALSWVPLKLKPSANGRDLSIATGFFYQHNDRSFLITNYHVVRGVDPNTGTILDSKGAIPDTLTLGATTCGSITVSRGMAFNLRAPGGHCKASPPGASGGFPGRQA